MMRTWQHVWPKSRGLKTNGIAESLARLSIAAGDEFPNALTAVQAWLLPLDHVHYIVNKLNESGLCNRFPVDALRLLNAVIDDQPWRPPELGQCLENIVKASPKLQQDLRYQKLVDYAKRHGS